MDRPNSGNCYEMMKISKRQCKNAVRRLKKVNDKMKNEKFVASVIGVVVQIFLRKSGE